jgi:2-oxoglutarate dehydrogenase E2 component (dihydrolipoamide succinyltransferase)
MGESIAEGTVSVWLKKVGERVERDEPIMEISTDKVDAEIPSPVGGVLSEVVVQEGETVEVGTVVAYVETDASAVVESSAAPPAPVAAAPQLPEAAVGQPELPAPAQAAAREERAAAAAGEAVAEARREVAEPAPEPAGAESLEARIRSHSSPLVRRIAEENGVELSRVSGTGRLGRVTKGDILAYLERREAEPATGYGRAAAPRAGAAEGGALDWSEFYTHVEHPTVEIGEGDRVEPMSRMTKLIAEHMVLSRRTAPHVHSYIEVDYTRIDQHRAKHRRAWEEQGVKVSYTAYITRAVARALRDFPKVNASVSGDSVVYRAEVNIGIAVALPWGLIVPVIRNADELSLTGIARRVADLAERARSKRLSPEEVQGGTFTITNPGIFGTVIGFPIINQPQVAILCAGGVEKRPVVVSDEFGNDAIVARKRGFISLGFDHRIVNGADGDQFLARVRQVLEAGADEGE